MVIGPHLGPTTGALNVFRPMLGPHHDGILPAPAASRQCTKVSIYNITTAIGSVRKGHQVGFTVRPKSPNHQLSLLPVVREVLEVEIQACLPGEHFATDWAGVAVSLVMEPVPVAPQDVDRHQPPLPAALLGPALGRKGLQGAVCSNIAWYKYFLYKGVNGI